ncbi:MAG TPA: phosphotransferase [Thermodesulfobacteriota bacterium]|nr:phosphotransferase [Thermodesulfobacteriota bacterium]
MVTGDILSRSEQDAIISLVVNNKGKEDILQTGAQPLITLRLISGGGSDRSFYRIEKEGKSIILMISPPQDGEFQYYLDIGRFLRTLGIGVPEFYATDQKKKALFMEDVGEESLYLKFQRGMPEEEVICWYQKALETLAHMQIEGEKQWTHCPAVTERTFDYPTLRWETEYFQENFLEKYCGIDIPDRAGLSREFKALAEKVASEPLYFMHRDFQSQNIMIHRHEVRIIDFQGARRGLLQYDVAAVLKDAYVVLPEATRKKLLVFYLDKLEDHGLRIVDRDHFYEIFTLAGLQRNMQALGAFSFLSLVKGKEWFKQYITAGVAYLDQALQKRHDFPMLREIVKNVGLRLKAS